MILVSAEKVLLWRGKPTFIFKDPEYKGAVLESLLRSPNKPQDVILARTFLY